MSRGKPLSALIPADGLPPESVIRYGTQIADALAHAHERGIVHRDLKSANVVITPEGRAKVLDFGLAARMPQADAEAVTKTQEALPFNQTGMLVGTLAYMAPEVLRGEAATARSDIWALGVVLYEMASGRLPFEGETALDVTSAIAKDSPRALPSRVSAGLRGIVQRCLQKEAGSRYSGVIGVQGALEAVQSDAAVAQSVSLAPVSEARAWRWAAVVLGLVVAVGVIGYWLRPAAPDTMSAGAPRLANPTQVTGAVGEEDYPTWSPDGGRLAFQSGLTSPTGQDIWVTQLGGGEPVNLTADNAGRDLLPSWSPDGRDIAFVSERDGTWGVYTMPAVGGNPRHVMALARVADSPGRTGPPQWSGDGTELTVSVRDGERNFAEVVVVGPQETRRIPLPEHEGFAAFNLSRSPDGRYFAYIDKNSAYEVTRLWVAAASGGEPIQVSTGRTNAWSPSWSADGHTLFFVSNRGGAMDLWQQRISIDGTLEGDAEPITTGIGIRTAFFSSDGTKLAYSRGSRFGTVNLWRLPIFPDRPATWSDAEQLTFDDSAYGQMVDVSPDGQRLAMSSDRAGNQDVWILPSNGGPMTQLTTDPTPDWAPRWSPDGEQIAFVAYRSGNRDIWVMPATGGPARQLTSHPAVDFVPSWSPDGREIAFGSTRSGSWDIWIVPAVGGEPRPLTADPQADWDSAWSPDGNWLAYSDGGVDNTVGLRRIRPNGGEPEVLTTSGTIPRWSDDGSVLYYRGAGSVWALSLADRSERPVTDLTGRPGTLGSSLDIAGEYVYFGWRQRRADLWVMDVVQNDGSDD